MSKVLPPNPSLVAILLVVGSRNGPRFVFHYPEVPSEEPSRIPRWHGTYGSSVDADDQTATDDSDEGFSSEDDLDFAPSAELKSGLDRLRGRKYPWGPEDDESESSEPAGGIKDKGAAWETVLGYSTDGFESLLTPGKAFHNKKFEVTLGNLVFLSYPVHLREDGFWMKKRERRKKSGGKSESDDLEAMSKSDHSIRTAKLQALNEQNGGAKKNGIESSAIADDEARSELTDDESAMTMFNVVFVLNPPALEYHLRIEEMYDHVVKKFTKALKYQQARSDYVWRQSDMILSLREKAKESRIPFSVLWQNILIKSTLARALSEVYLSISASKIAHVFLSDNFDVSLQIPQVGETSQLPGLMDPPVPGLWLTTANSYDQDESDSSNQLAKHFALLLLDSPTTILKEVEDAAPTTTTTSSSSALSAPLAHYIRHSKPTLSFQQVSTLSGLSLPDINILARHLIYWRRARAIPPLHQRDIYIVSPNADMRALPVAAAEYARVFPSLPSLRKILAVLSGPLHPYSAIIPSKDHRPAYLEILAWLVRGGWVTQLRTFAWVRISPAVKASVARQMAAEAAAATASSTSPPVVATETATSPSLSPSPGTEDRGPEDLPPSMALPVPAPVPSSSSSGNNLAGSASILTDPHRASGLESRWIAAVGAGLRDPVARELWCRRGVARYFNGRHALEKIWVREGLGVGTTGGGGGGGSGEGKGGLRRKEVLRAFGEMEEEGAIVVARHW